MVDPGAPMHRLVIDEGLCTRCGRCEGYLPDVLRHFATRPDLLISAANLERHGMEIEAALGNCFMGALSLKPIQ